VSKRPSPEHDDRAPERARGGDEVPDEDETLAQRPDEADHRTTPLLPLDLLGTYVVGFAMGTADVVPGFSGGTVALVAGIYERLVANVRQGARALSLLLRGRIGEGLRAVGAIEWGFVVALLAGVISAIAALAAVLERQLEVAPVQMSALFFGLVIGATVVATQELRAPGVRHIGVGLIVALVTFVALGYRGATGGEHSLAFVFVAGAVAVCAMILPGVSGSFLLLLLGAYSYVIAAVSGRDLVVIAVFAAGCLVGLASFSTLLNWLLQRYHDLVLAALIGLMAGSARVLWPWPSVTVGDPTLGAPVADDVPLVLTIVLGAIVAVVLLALLSRRVARST
jgi:putative membrane protein